VQAARLHGSRVQASRPHYDWAKSAIFSSSIVPIPDLRITPKAMEGGEIRENGGKVDVVGKNGMILPLL